MKEDNAVESGVRFAIFVLLNDSHGNLTYMRNTSKFLRNMFICLQGRIEH